MRTKAGPGRLVCLTARDLNPELNTVARAWGEESADRLRRAGADHVISPTLTGGIRMASTLLRPHVVSFLDEKARIPQHTGLVVIALQRRGGVGEHIFNPGPETLLEDDDVMIVLGKEDQVQRLRDYALTG